MSDAAIHPALPRSASAVVVLQPRGRTLTPVVWNELTEFQARVVVVQDQPRVLVELRRGAQAVLLPEADDDAFGELLAAIARYHPQVTRHTCNEGTAPAPLRITEGDPSQRLASPTPSSRHDSASMLTDEELAMLMGPINEG